MTRSGQGFQAACSTGNAEGEHAAGEVGAAKGATAIFFQLGSPGSWLVPKAELELPSRPRGACG
jgi:hypothetical protein